MKRIIIIGNPGSGKSTLASSLGRILNLPVIHLDSHFWQPGWVKTPREIWLEKVREMVAGEKWLIDGTYDSSIDIRVPRADTVIFLDFPTVVSLWRILKRLFENYGGRRPDMADGCLERFDYHFIRYVWGFRKNIRPHIIDAIERLFTGETLITIRNSRELRTFLERISDGRSVS